MALSWRGLARVSAGAGSLPRGWARQRPLWHWVNVVFNRVDRSRVRDVGPDKAAAEWALRLGGRVRFHGNEFWSTDYNRLPNRPPSESLLDQIDVGGVAITDNGLEHLDGLCALRRLCVSRCLYLTDAGLSHLSLVAASLQELDLSHCPQLTPAGLRHLRPLTSLLQLDVSGLAAADVASLQAALPGCLIKH